MLMLRNLHINADFGGLIHDIHGNLVLKSRWDAVKKGILTTAIIWLLGVMLVVVPFVNWTLPAIFLAFGPVLGWGTYLADRRALERLDAETVCPHCKSPIEIHEQKTQVPIYGSCPHCHASFQVHVPEIEYRE